MIQTENSEVGVSVGVAATPLLLQSTGARRKGEERR